MFRTITAEFDSQDEANSVSAHLRNTVTGIESSDIISDNINEYNPYGHPGLANVNIAGKFLTSNYGIYGMGINNGFLSSGLNIEDDFQRKTQVSRKAVLTIVCTNESLAQTEKFLIAKGGHNIQKI